MICWLSPLNQILETVHVLEIGACRHHNNITPSSAWLLLLDELARRMANKMRFVGAILQTQTDLCVGPSPWGQQAGIVVSDPSIHLCHLYILSTCASFHHAVHCLLDLVWRSEIQLALLEPSKELSAQL